MKQRASGRPIGKCNGCCLNRRTSCAGGLEPKAQWDRGKCSLFNDFLILEKLAAAAPPTGAKAAKLARRQRAAFAGTVPHHNGQVAPAHAFSRQ
jgi:hypothetical protein